MARHDYANPPILETAGAATNPTANDVLADTGALAAGLYEVAIIWGGTVANGYIVQRRNAANAASVGDIPVFFGAADQTGGAVLVYELEASERLRVLARSSVTGVVCATLQVEKLT